MNSQDVVQRSKVFCILAEATYTSSLSRVGKLLDELKMKVKTVRHFVRCSNGLLSSEKRAKAPYFRLSFSPLPSWIRLLSC